MNIYDPFCGSGTVIVEAARFKCNAIGRDINPAAVAMASVYKFLNHRKKERREYLKQAVPEWLRRTCDWKMILQESTSLPHVQVDVSRGDARRSDLENGSVDLILTSPPYINVINYHQQYREQMEGQGYDILGIARDEIGSNRKNRGNRFKTIIEYVADMTSVLRDMRRVLKEDSRAIIIVGRISNVCKTIVYNSKIVEDLATLSCGFTLESKEERRFKNRFGKIIIEDVIVLLADDLPDMSFDTSAYALETLKSLKPPDESGRLLLRDAIASIHRAQA